MFFFLLFLLFCQRRSDGEGIVGLCPRGVVSAREGALLSVRVE